MAETTSNSASEMGIGALLRASRMRIGEDLRDVAGMLRIRYPYLEAIEEGRFRDLPGQAYAVGFVRAYADHLGLDGEEVVRRFKEEVADGGKSRTNLHFPTPVTEANVPGGAIVFIGLLVAFLAYGGWYVSTSDENYLADLIEPIPERLSALISPDGEEPISNPDPAPSAETASSTEQMPAAAATEKEPAGDLADATPGSISDSDAADTARPVDDTNQTPTPAPAPSAAAIVPVETAPVGETGEAPRTAPTSPPAPTSTPTPAPLPTPPLASEATPQASETARQTPVASTETPAEALASADPVPAIEETPASTSRVLVRAKSNSWIQVQDDFSNEMLATRLLEAGEEYHVPNKFGLRLLTGNAGALEILVDGQPVPPIGEEGAVRRGVQLDPDLLKAGQAVSE